LAVILDYNIIRANIADNNRLYSFFGDYIKVQRSLTRLKIKDGVLIFIRIKKDSINRLAYRFLGENSDKYALSLNYKFKP
jgi:hypothetical protein